jgi:hypothetical protein
MTEDTPESAVRAFESSDAYEGTEAGFLLTTSAFGGRVSAVDLADDRVAYTVTVRVPTIEAATADEVGEAVQSGWFETLERRLADAPKATRANVDLSGFEVEQDGAEAVVTYQFEYGGADRAAEIAKTFAEYVEGTYVESIVPGYDYEGTAADLLASASEQGGGERGGTPL